MIAHSSAELTYIDEWRPCPGPNGILTPYLFEHADGRKRLYFAADGENICGREDSRDVNRVSYRVFDEGSLLLGVTVEKARRGVGLGR